MYSLNTVQNVLVMGEKGALINIASGGNKEIYLNSLIEKYTGKPIFAGTSKLLLWVILRFKLRKLM